MRPAFCKFDLIEFVTLFILEESKQNMDVCISCYTMDKMYDLHHQPNILFLTKRGLFQDRF